MIKLDNKNGLYKFVSNIVKSEIEMYLDNNNGKISLYCELKEGLSVERLKLMIADYIGRNLLMDSYREVVIYSW